MMKQNHSRLSLKPFWLILIISMGALLVGTVCCTTLDIFPKESRAPKEYPDTEIVFQTSGGVGFVNADGSNEVSIPLAIKDHRGNISDWWRPIMTENNHTLIVKVIDYLHHVYTPAPLAVWRVGEFPILCQQWGAQPIALLSADQGHIFIQTEKGLALYNLESCGTENIPIKVYEKIHGIPSPNLQYVASIIWPDNATYYERFIVIHNIVSGEERTIGEGNYPIWSRDSQWVAYTGQDGIYIFNAAEGMEARRVVQYSNLFDGRYPTYSAGDYNEIPPEVSWSPDGKWLVYHRWHGTDYYTGVEPYYNSIYKVNVETGEEIKIIDGGMYPYWRWPVENQQ